jgi:Pectate lyase superfamily protein
MLLRGADREVHLSSRCRTTVLLLAAVLLALSLSATPASSATTASKAARFVVVKRTTTNVIVERGTVRLEVRLGSRFVSVHGVPRYRVVKRARSYYLLMPVVNVVAYGAKHDGRTDDTAAIARAMRAAVNAAKGVYVPAGTYRVSSITMPAGLAVFGAGMGRAWLKGHLAFGSNELISDLTIGDAGKSAVHNKAGAAGSVFARVHFRGGGGSGWHAPVILLGGSGSCSNITFKRCEVERNVGIEDSSFSNCYNDITVYESRGDHVSDITFDGCHVGVTNGVATGSPRMGLECWTAPGSGIGWRNIIVRDCVFEATAIASLDFANYTDAIASGVLVEGCTLKGGGLDLKGTGWGYAICLEWPADVTIRNNTFYRSAYAAIWGSPQGLPGAAWRITGNTFDDDTACGGMPRTDRCIVGLFGQGNVFTGNKVKFHGSLSWSGTVELSRSDGDTVTGNTFFVNRGTTTIHPFNATNYTITPNKVVYP